MQQNLCYLLSLLAALLREGVRNNEQLRYLQGSRTFAALSLKSADQLRISILHKLVEASNEPFKGSQFEPQQLEEAKKMEHEGYLFCDRSAYSFWTPLHLAYAQQCLYYNTVKRDSVHAPDSFKSFIEAVIERMIRQGDLKQTLSVSSNNKVLESKWQALFCQAALSLLPRDYEVAPDVGPVGRDCTATCLHAASVLPQLTLIFEAGLQGRSSRAGLHSFAS